MLSVTTAGVLVHLPPARRQKCFHESETERPNRSGRGRAFVQPILAIGSSLRFLWAFNHQWRRIRQEVLHGPVYFLLIANPLIRSTESRRHLIDTFGNNLRIGRKDRLFT